MATKKYATYQALVLNGTFLDGWMVGEELASGTWVPRAIFSRFTEGQRWRDNGLFNRRLLLVPTGEVLE